MTIPRPLLPSLLALLLTAGCSSYNQPVQLAALPDTLPPTDRFEVWTRGQSYQLHALKADSLTIQGVRWWHAPDCDSCLVTIPRAEVDSIRIPGHDGGKTGVFLIVAAPVVFVWILIRSIPYT